MRPYSATIQTDLSFKMVGNSTVGQVVLLPNATFGPTDKPILITNSDNLVNVYTPNNTLEVGMDNAFYSALAFLEQGNQTFALRVLGAGATYGDYAVSGTGAVVAAPITAGGTATNTAIPVAGAFTLYAENQGAWSANLTFNVLNYTAAPVAATATTSAVAADPYSVKEVDCFKIEVYLSGVLKETHTCSLNPASKDGYGSNLFIVDVLKIQSQYLRAAVNPAYTGVLPTEVGGIYPLPIPLLTSTITTTAAASVAMGAGVNGSAATSLEATASIKVFEDAITYPCKVICDGGLAVPAYQHEIDRIAQYRQDCVGLLSAPRALSLSPLTAAQDLVNYRAVTLNLNSSYSALYAPWVQIDDPYTGRRGLSVSPDGYAAAAIARNASHGARFNAPAGDSVPLNVIGLDKEFSDAEQNILYDNQINPIVSVHGGGIQFNGQKTLQSRPSDTDRLNVRLMLTEVAPAVKKYMAGFKFTNNTSTSRALAKAGVELFMDGIKADGGVYDFYVKCDTSNNTPAIISQNRMRLQVFLQAEITAEFIDSEIIITPRTMSLSAAAKLV